MWEIVKSGGLFIWPIILCSIISIAIIVERLWTLQPRRVLPRELAVRVKQLVEADQINDRVIGAIAANSSLGSVLAVGLANRHKPRAVMMERLEDTGRHVVHDLERFLNTLGTIAAVAPLLGLLGTVSGIIRAFNEITVGGMGNPQLLASGIAEALVATAAGLTVAIPSLVAYRYLRGRVDRIVIGMEKVAIELVDSVEATNERRLQQPDAQSSAA